jgi:hypothetical protein
MKPKDRKKHLYLPNEEINKNAQIAYETYAVAISKKNAPGNYMPVWDDLNVNQKNAWRQVVIKLAAGTGKILDKVEE